jgi:glucose/arabinose dehydrogenase
MRVIPSRLLLRLLSLATVVALLLPGRPCPAQPFTVSGPAVNPNDFRVTTFANTLSFPLGMAELPDGSLLVTSIQNPSFSSGTNPGRLVRFTDTNGDGIADDAGTILYSNLSPALTAVRTADKLVFVMGRPHPITVLRMGATPTAPFTLAGKLIFNYPSGWNMHQHSELLVRKTPGFTNRYDLFFQIGAEVNYAATTRTATLTNENIPGASGSLAGDSIHMLTIIDTGAALSATNLTQVAAGCRNAAGFAFHPATGDFYFQDNGIDGLVNGNEPHSADELNVIARTNLGGPVEFFGFPSNYTAYRTGTFVGGAGLPPLVAFQPIPDPATGAEAEGANQISFAPPGFPDGLNTGLFLGFHGKYGSAGTANEENPVVYADPATGNYFHFIPGRTAGIGHLDGLLATRDSLFVADLVTTGSLSSGANAGVIYQIKSLVTPSLPTLTIAHTGSQPELRWDRGALHEADEITGPWTAVADAFSPMLLSTTAARKFYRTMY